MRKTAIILASTALLSACGGGGDGGGVTSAGPAAPISAANQTAVAQDTLQTSSMLLQSSEQSPLAAAVVINEKLLMQVVQAQRDKLPSYIASAPKLLAGASISLQAIPCAVSGTIGGTVNDADNNSALSAGDSVSLSFSNCSDGTSTINGSLGFAIDGLNQAISDANPPSYPVIAQTTMSFGNLSVSGAGFLLSANGSVSVADNLNGVNHFSRTITTTSFSVSATLAGTTRSRSVSNYSASFSRVPDATYVYVDTQAVTGRVSGSNAQETVTVDVATPTAFVRRGPDRYPYAGQAVLTGLNSSALRVTAIDNMHATLELDADGDGSYEAITNPPVLWSALLN